MSGLCQEPWQRLYGSHTVEMLGRHCSPSDAIVFLWQAKRLLRTVLFWTSDGTFCVPKGGPRDRPLDADWRFGGIPSAAAQSLFVLEVDVICNAIIEALGHAGIL